MQNLKSLLTVVAIGGLMMITPQTGSASPLATAASMQASEADGGLVENVGYYQKKHRRHSAHKRHSRHYAHHRRHHRYYAHRRHRYYDPCDYDYAYDYEYGCPSSFGYYGYPDFGYGGLPFVSFGFGFSGHHRRRHW